MESTKRWSGVNFQSSNDGRRWRRGWRFQTKKMMTVVQFSPAGGSRQENDGGIAQNPLMSARGPGRLNVTAMRQQPGTAKYWCLPKNGLLIRSKDKKSAA